MKKLAFYIDGFNVYHSIDENPAFHKYKWLNYAKLAQSFSTKNEQISGIFYFTAYYEHDPQRVDRHKKLVAALESCGVTVVLGKYKIKNRRCHRFPHLGNCRMHEEKETDVNIAIKLFQGAMTDLYDTAVIVSGDSDLTPSVRAVKQTFPQKRIGVIFPANRISRALEQEAHFRMNIKEKHLKNSQFPDVVTLADGRQISRPRSWR